MTRDPGPILSLDPSSTVIGYAAMTPQRHLLDAGLITPAARSDPSWDRVQAMCDDLVILLERHRPSVILLEWTKGRVNTRRHGGMGAGLAVYGCGVGAVGRQCVVWSRANPGCRVVPVLENDWTRGVPKGQRQLAVAAAYPAYAPHIASDAGGDISDAIGMTDWWLKENLLLALRPG